MFAIQKHSVDHIYVQLTFVEIDVYLFQWRNIFEIYWEGPASSLHIKSYLFAHDSSWSIPQRNRWKWETCTQTCCLNNGVRTNVLNRSCVFQVQCAVYLKSCMDCRHSSPSHIHSNPFSTLNLQPWVVRSSCHFENEFGVDLLKLLKFTFRSRKNVPFFTMLQKFERYFTNFELVGRKWFWKAESYT